MLTSLYYYDYYKPYFLKTEQDTDKLKIITADNRINVVTLNKILKDEVISYAFDVSDGVLKIKNSSAKLCLDIQQFNNIETQDMNMFENLLTESIDDFVYNFNKYINMMSEQQHSDKLKVFARNISERLYMNIEKLSILGIYKNQKELLFDSNKLDVVKNFIDNIVDDIINVFNDIYLEAFNIMQYPLSEHMNFIPFNFYYNYTFGNPSENSFKMIQRGMIVNIIA